METFSIKKDQTFWRAALLGCFWKKKHRDLDLSLFLMQVLIEM